MTYFPLASIILVPPGIIKFRPICLQIGKIKYNPTHDTSVFVQLYCYWANCKLVTMTSCILEINCQNKSTLLQQTTKTLLSSGM